MSDISDAIGGDFDTNSVPPATGFEPIPAGWYPCQIDGAEVKDTKKGNGKILAVELTIVGEEYAGRKLWPRINLVNPNPKAVEIGMRELSAIGQACGLAAITDTSELIGNVVLARVKVRQEEGREPDNEVQGYKPTEEIAPAAEKPAAKPAPTAAKPVAKPAPTAAKATKRPWEW